MEKNHTSSDLFRNANSSFPGQGHCRFVKDVEESGSMAVFIDNIVKILMLSDSNQGNKLRVMSDLHRSHDLSFELFLSTCTAYVIFDFLYGYFSSSP